MSDLSISLHWERSGSAFRAGAYSTAHAVRYNDACEVEADAAPGHGGDPRKVNPEQALAAALSSCHMLTFLALAAKTGWPVSGYEDRAVAHLGKIAGGKTSVVRIELNPAVAFDPGFSVEPDEMQKMHDRAHRYCFVGNALAESVAVSVEPSQKEAAVS